MGDDVNARIPCALHLDSAQAPDVELLGFWSSVQDSDVVWQLSQCPCHLPLALALQLVGFLVGQGTLTK